MNRILYNKLTSIKIDKFESNHFSLSFLHGWRQVRKLINKSVADFVNTKNYIGVLQISSFQHPSKTYDINETKKEIEKKGNLSQIITISDYQALVYALNYSNEKLYQFLFEIGHKNKRLLITLTFENNDITLINRNYDEVLKILNTLKFKD